MSQFQPALWLGIIAGGVDTNIKDGAQQVNQQYSNRLGYLLYLLPDQLADVPCRKSARIFGNFYSVMIAIFEFIDRNL